AARAQSRGAAGAAPAGGADLHHFDRADGRRMMTPDPRRRRRNFIAVLASLGIVAGMSGLAYASVPLYRLYCQLTGYQGATKTALRAPDAVSTATITVRLDANVNKALHWSFAPETPSVTMPLGQSVTAVYRVKNLSNQQTVGSATFNVTPFD